MARYHTGDEFTKPTSTIIGKSFKVNASRISCDDDESMRIDGAVIGDIVIGGVVNVGASGVVQGSISAGSVRIGGRIYGNVTCKRAVHLTETAEISGNITAAKLIIDSGAIIDGVCKSCDPVDIAI